MWAKVDTLTVKLQPYEAGTDTINERTVPSVQQPLLPFEIDPPVENWARLLAPYPTLLIIAPDRVADTLLEVVMPHLRKPIHVKDCIRSVSDWPEGGTLILRNIEALDQEHQAAMLRWLDEAHDETQLVSVASSPVYPHVEAGTFLEGLYYRLNVVTLSVESSTPAS